jgi:haloalkane dehalogenase
MTVLRTPDHCFTNLPDFSFEPHYIDIEDPDLGTLRMHYLDEGPVDGQIMLCMHGEPSWSYLYRKMIPGLVAAGFRVLAPDLVGFGRSDKPADTEDYSFAKHVSWMTAWVAQLDLQDATLVAQDWGGLIGLRLVAEMPERFARVTISNTGLPTGDQGPSEAFLAWRNFSLTDETFDIGMILNDFGQGALSEKEQNAYRAPFPDDNYKAGARKFPSLVPTSVDDPARDANLAAWEVLKTWDKPFLCCFSDQDPITGGGEKVFLKLVPGCQDQPHATLHGGHFIQQVDGERWSSLIVDWVNG